MTSALRSEVLLAKAAGPRVAAVAALDQVRHVATRRVLRIKASPPVFEAAVEALEAALFEDFVERTRELFAAAQDDLAEIASSELPVDARELQATARLDRLDQELTEAGRAHPASTRRALGYTLATTYRLGQEEVVEVVPPRRRARKADGVEVLGAFDVEDQDVLAALNENGLFWVGEHYGDEVDGIGFRKAVGRVIAKEGLGRAEAGRAVGRLFDGKIERSRSYWKGFAATVATRSRSFGALREMRDLGVRVYEYINPLDERTSDVCRHLDGTRFEVELGIKLRDRLLQVQDPEEWKAIAPWPRDVEELEGLTPAELQARGIAWPPLHFHCRSAIEVVLEELPDFDDVPDDFDEEENPLVDEDASPDEDGGLYQVPEDPGLLGTPRTVEDLVLGPGHGRPVSGLVKRSDLLEASDEPRIGEVTGAFDLVPKELQEAARDAGALVHVYRWLPDRYPHLKGRPRGWRRGSWKDVVGCGGADATMAVRGTKGGWGFRHTTLHEWGHALDFVNRRGSAPSSLSASDRWRKVWKRAKRKPRGGQSALVSWYQERHGRWAEPRYFLQKPPAGPEEFFAEIVAEVYNSPESRALVVKHFPGLVEELAGLLGEAYNLTP